MREQHKDCRIPQKSAQRLIILLALASPAFIIMRRCLSLGSRRERNQFCAWIVSIGWWKRFQRLTINEWIIQIEWFEKLFKDWKWPMIAQINVCVFWKWSCICEVDRWNVVETYLWAGAASKGLLCLTLERYPWGFEKVWRRRSSGCYFCFWGRTWWNGSYSWRLMQSFTGRFMEERKRQQLQIHSGECSEENFDLQQALCVLLPIDFWISWHFENNGNYNKLFPSWG